MQLVIGSPTLARMAQFEAPEGLEGTILAKRHPGTTEAP